MQFLPSLACKVGTERAILLQQIHYLLQLPQSGCEIDGHHFIWNTAEDFARHYFKWLKPKTINYHLKILEKLKILVVAQPGKSSGDMKKFFRIDYEWLDKILLDAADLDEMGNDELHTISNILEVPISNELEMPFPTDEKSLKEQKTSSLQENSHKEAKDVVVVGVRERYRIAGNDEYRQDRIDLYENLLAWLEGKRRVKTIHRPMDWAKGLDDVIDRCGYDLDVFKQAYEWFEKQNWTKNISPFLIKEKFEDFLQEGYRPVSPIVSETEIAAELADDTEESLDYIHSVLKAVSRGEKGEWLPTGPESAGKMFRGVCPGINEELFRNEFHSYFTSDEFPIFCNAYFEI